MLSRSVEMPEAQSENALKYLRTCSRLFLNSWSNIWKDLLPRVTFLDCNTLLENSSILKEEQKYVTPKYVVKNKVVLGVTQKDNQDFDAILCQQEIIFSLFPVIHILLESSCCAMNMTFSSRPNKINFIAMRATWHAQQITIVHVEMQLNKT